MKIHIDLLLIQDVLLITFVLLIVSRLINVRISVGKALLSSTIVSFLSLLILIYQPLLYENIFVKVVFAYLVIKLSFPQKEKIPIIAKVIAFCAVIFLLGGIITMVEGNALLIIAITGIMVTGILMLKKKMKKQLMIENISCILEFSLEEKEYCLKALMDTGHDVKTFLGEDIIFIKKNLCKIGGGKERRLVSYQTISGEEQKVGEKVKNIKIIINGIVKYANAVIVEAPNMIKGYDAIVSYDFVEGGMQGGDNAFNKRESKKTFFEFSNHTRIK